MNLPWWVNLLIMFAHTAGISSSLIPVWPINRASTTAGVDYQRLSLSMSAWSHAMKFEGVNVCPYKAWWVGAGMDPQIRSVLFCKTPAFWGRAGKLKRRQCRNSRGHTTELFRLAGNGAQLWLSPGDDWMVSRVQVIMAITAKKTIVIKQT